MSEYFELGLAAFLFIILAALAHGFLRVVFFILCIYFGVPLVRYFLKKLQSFFKEANLFRGW